MDFLAGPQKVIIRKLAWNLLFAWQLRRCASKCYRVEMLGRVARQNAIFRLLGQRNERSVQTLPEGMNQLLFFFIFTPILLGFIISFIFRIHYFSILTSKFKVRIWRENVSMTTVYCQNIGYVWIPIWFLCVYPLYERPRRILSGAGFGRTSWSYDNPPVLRWAIGLVDGPVRLLSTRWLSQDDGRTIPSIFFPYGIFVFIIFIFVLCKMQKQE